ncbi:hypothetical protein HN748_01415 [Candidatus Peregrinibacteria bacterium]|jgi:hypothetical protein|nr:hypothetical protein [Candidatus Peregrinibacteria bacterium]MBT7702869.1 hypothetical protein [Candidatus Peregrinibacteria bacterium]
MHRFDQIEHQQTDESQDSEQEEVNPPDGGSSRDARIEQRQARRDTRREKLKKGTPADKALKEMERRVEALSEEGSMEKFYAQLERAYEDDYFLNFEYVDAFLALEEQLQEWQVQKEADNLNPEEQALLQQIEQLFNRLHRRVERGLYLNAHKPEQILVLLRIRPCEQIALDVLRKFGGLIEEQYDHPEGLFPDLVEQASLVILEKENASVEAFQAIVRFGPVDCREQARTRLQIILGSPSWAEGLTQSFFGNQEVHPTERENFTVMLQRLVEAGCVSIDQEFIDEIDNYSIDEVFVENLFLLHEGGFFVDVRLIKALKYKIWETPFIEGLVEIKQAGIELTPHMISRCSSLCGTDPVYIANLITLHQAEIEIDMDVVSHSSEEVVRDPDKIAIILSWHEMGVRIRGNIFRDYDVDYFENESYRAIVQRLMDGDVGPFSTYDVRNLTLEKANNPRYIQALLDIAAVNPNKPLSPSFCKYFRINEAEDKGYVKGLIEYLQAGLPLNSFWGAPMFLALNTEELADEDYIAKIAALDQAGADINIHFLNTFTPEKARNEKFMSVLYQFIDAGVRVDDNFVNRLSDELVEDDFYIQTLCDLAKAGAEVTADFFNALHPDKAREEEKVKSFYELLEQGFELGAYEFMNWWHNPDKLASLEYRATLLDLQDSGIKIRWIFDDITVEAAQDTVFIDVLKRFFRLGVEEETLLRMVTPEKSHDSNYIGLLEELILSGLDLREIDWSVMEYCLSDPGYVEALFTLRDAGVVISENFINEFKNRQADEQYVQSLIEMSQMGVLIDDNFLSLLNYESEKSENVEFLEVLKDLAVSGVKVDAFFARDFDLELSQNSAYVEALKQTKGVFRHADAYYLAQEMEADYEKVLELLSNYSYLDPEAVIDLYEFRCSPNISDYSIQLIDAGFPSQMRYFVYEMNHLHNEGDEARLEVVEGFDAGMLYLAMVFGNEEVYTSSFRLLFDKLLVQMELEGLDGADLVNKADVRYENLSIFFQTCARYGRLSDFLSTIPNQNKKENLIKNFIQSLTNVEDPLATTVAISEVMELLAENEPEMLEILEEMIVDLYEGFDGKTKALYGIIASKHAEVAVTNQEWFAARAIEYPIPEIEYVSEERLFNENGENIQWHFFYNDEDGATSFNHFVETYRTSGSWRYEDKGLYVTLKKRRGGRTIIIYANKPSEPKNGREAIRATLEREDRVPQVIVHRGHSYHVGKTQSELQEGVAIVNLGSCGGFGNLSWVLKHSPGAAVIATKGVGTKYVNDPLFKMLNETILRNGTVEWEPFWERAERNIHHRAFNGYVAPNENVGLMMISAYNNFLERAED